MSRVVVIGSGPRVRGFALAGASVVVADDESQVTAAWESLDPDVGLLVLTPEAAGILGPLAGDRPRLLTVVMP